MVGYERHGALVVCVIFVLSVTAFQPIGAEQAATSTEQGSHSNNPVNLDLTSTTRNLAAPNFVQNGPVAIEVGGVTRSIDSASVLTPAERLATWQVFSTGQQSIQLGSSGNATGGSFTMGAKFSQYVNSLVIPQGVTAVRDFGTASVLNLSGNLTNAGSLFAVSSNAAVTNAVINANNIINQPGALLSSILPVGALPGISSAVSNLSITLNALQNIINAGTISSAGSLTATAGGSIINSLPAGIVGPNPIMQAINNVGINASSILNSGIVTAHTGDVNITAVTTAANSNQLLNSLATAQIINQGAIASLTGNINIAKSISGQLVSELTQDLAINNSGGLMEAINGNIAINSPGFLVLHNTDGALNARNNVAISSLPPLSHSSSPDHNNGDWRSYFRFEH